MQKSFINILSIGSLWDSGSLFKIHLMPYNWEYQYCAETHPSAIIHFRQLTEQYESRKRLWEILNSSPQAKTNFRLAGSRKRLPSSTMRGFHMKYDSIMFLLNSDSVQLNAHFCSAWGSSFQQNNDGVCSTYPGPNRAFNNTSLCRMQADQKVV